MKKQCPSCGGSGQIGYFQGVSRFLLTWEECPLCHGTGFCTAEKKPLTEQRKDIQGGPGAPKRKKDSG